MRIICSWLMISLFLGCSSDSNNDPIDSRKVVPQAEIKNETKVAEIIDDATHDFDLKLADSSGINIDSVKGINLPLFPDRFSPKNVKKLSLITGRDSIIYYQWAFKDSLKTKNALYNWLDCFGKDCRSIKLYEPAKFQKDNFIIFVNDTSLSFISSERKLELGHWLTYFKYYSKIEDWPLVIFQKSRANASWVRVEKEKQTNLTRE